MFLLTEGRKEMADDGNKRNRYDYICNLIWLIFQLIYQKPNKIGIRN